METTRDIPISQYIDQVGRLPRLSREREAELCRNWQATREPQAKDTLVQANLRYVVVIALKYRHYGLPIGELIAEGNFGLLHALEKFEPERGLRFMTYAAYWIRAHILATVCRSWSLVSAGSGTLRTKTFFKLRRERARIVNLLGEGDAAIEALAKRFEVSSSQMAEMLLRLESRDLSLDCPVANDRVTTYVDNLVSPGRNQEQAYEYRQNERRTYSVVQSALQVLDQRERFVVEQRLMKDDEEQLSLAEMGRQLGVSRERVRQLQTRALRKLRAQLVAHSDNKLAGGSFVGSAA